MPDHAAIVTAVAPDPIDPNLRRIEVDGREVMTLPPAAVDALAIDVGQPWTAQLEEDARLEAAATRARADALRMLGRRDQSRAELAERLAQAGHEAPAVERALHHLEADRWLDDETLAKSIVGRTRARQPAGPALLVGRLVDRGVALEVAERVVAAALHDVDLVAEAAALLGRRLGARHDPASVRRATAALHRRGFDGGTIEAALDRLGLADAAE